jgi:hypothetical protein
MSWWRAKKGEGRVVVVVAREGAVCARIEGLCVHKEGLLFPLGGRQSRGRGSEVEVER